MFMKPGNTVKFVFELVMKTISIYFIASFKWSLTDEGDAVIIFNSRVSAELIEEEASEYNLYPAVVDQFIWGKETIAIKAVHIQTPESIFNNHFLQQMILSLIIMRGTMVEDMAVLLQRH